MPAHRGWPPVAHVAAEMGISRTCAYRWWGRYRQTGLAGLVDRPSCAHHHPRRTSAQLEAAVVVLRQSRKLGPARIAPLVGLPASTVYRVLCRYRLGRLQMLDRPSGQIIRRYERLRPGELIHMDVKKLGRLRQGGGHRVHGRDSLQQRRRDRKHGPGYDYVHAAVDDHSRLAYAEVLADERGDSCAGFLRRAGVFFASHGIQIQRVLTDNAFAYRHSRQLQQVIAELGAGEGIGRGGERCSRPWRGRYSSPMRAAVHTSYGPPEVVRIAEVDKPTAKDNQVLVKVHATTVNRTDSGFRAGKPFIVRFITGLIRPRVTVLGNEFAGEVEAVGAGVTSFAVGDRVFGYSGLQHGSRFGAHAEYLAMSEDGSLAAMPANLIYEQAAPSTEGAHYALTMIRAAKIQRGQDVLVYGATGAIGSAAVQLLKSLGAQVIAVCGTEHLELVRGLGADRVIDFTAEDFTRDEQTYDVVLDAVGKSSFFRCRRLLKPGGIYLSSDGGPLNQNLVLVLVSPLVGVVGGKKVLFRVPRDDQEMVRYFKELLETGAFRPLIDRRYRLDQIVEAYTYVETGQKIGNVVITVDSST